MNEETDKTSRNIDWHIHSNASDGFFKPENLVYMAKELAVDMAITDHDTISGIPVALKNAQELGYPIVSGVELSIYIGKPVHMLGYHLDTKRLDDFEKELKDEQEKRDDKIKLMIERAHEKGLWKDIDFDEIRAENSFSAYISRIHVAAELFRKGQCKNVLEGLDAVNREGLYEMPEFRSPANGLELLAKYCKVFSLAHLTSLRMEDFEEERLIRELMEHGLNAIESISSKYNDEQIVRYIDLAKKYGLRITAGSDFHWEESTPKARIGIDLNATLTDKILQGLGMQKQEIYELLVAADSNG